MNWMEILGLVIVFWFATALSYKKGVKQGIKHSLRKLELEQYQIEKLNKELKKDSFDLAVEAFKEDLSAEGKLLN
tara:strand:- start:95 stop:319 length:225 start_codon:yes stop_codon:yes gene_type:complete